VSLALPFGRVARPRRRRLRRALIEAGSALFGLALLLWSLIPVYNMVLIALDPEGDTEFAGYVWPPEPSLESFRKVLTEDYWYLEHFWRQFGNSVYVGVATTVLTMLIGSLASFAAGRLRRRTAPLLTNAALLTYVLPSAFLAIPFAHLAQRYGLADNLWAVIAAEVMLATPFAMLILQHYARLIPLELDEAARIDGASAVQLYLRIYLPLMAPALAAVGTYALLLAWGEYLYQYMLLSSARHWTVGVALEQFWDSDEAPWNYMMALALLFALPPVATFYGLRRFIATGLAGPRRRTY
jgi:multiple sugar transport system permease protein